jgi:hypothetical protein
MVDIEELTTNSDDADTVLPLPLGVRISGRTVNASSVVGLQASEFETIDSTNDGWPTLVIGENDKPSEKEGVAIDYLGTWRDAPVQEIDLVLSQDRNWLAVVAFHTSDYAVKHANYEIEGYNGYELIDWPDYKETGFKGLEERIDNKVTPIMYTADHPVYEAIALQRADNVDTLEQMFDLKRYTTLMERKEKLFNTVVPREERWRDFDTEQFDQLQDLYWSVSKDDEEE